MKIASRAALAGAVFVALAGPWAPWAFALSPREPAVRDLRALHRAGQTFLTWRGAEPAPAELTWGEARQILEDSKLRYRIYANERPITEASLAKAQLVGEVGPLSAWNLNGRNVEYLIGQAMIQPDAVGELARNYNGLIYSWHMDHPRMDRYPLKRFVIDEKAGASPLPPGSGLYVHSPTKPGRRFYAVLAVHDGKPHTLILQGVNSLAEAVEETVGPGEPVCQGEGLWGPFFDYPGRRTVYVHWAAPPLAPSENVYFNWSVLVPPDVKDKAPVELYFHSGNYSYARPNVKYMADSIQIAPHDYPFSGWYGYNEAPFSGKDPAEGKVSNHTQKRIAAFMDWAARKLPVDTSRVIAVGGDGAAAMALAYPDRFAYVLITGFESRLTDRKAVRQFASAWGPQDPKLTDEKGRGEWSWAELDKLVLAEPGKDLPLFVCKGFSWGRHSTDWGLGRGRFYSAMHQARQPLYAHWAWGGNLAPPDRYTDLWRNLDIRNTTPVPAIANSSADAEGEGQGQTNTVYSWKDVTDEPDRFQITITGRESTFDLTPRRCQKFKVEPGEKLRWEVEALPDRRGQGGAKQSGQVVADEHGRVTLEKLSLCGGGLVITISRM